ncbi:MAG TPA: peptidoglycan DD-metalloendopeptidase family protein, partial [Thermodesulfobacteriota bacterium]
GETLARTRALEDELALQRRALEARAVALYKLGPLGPVQALLSASSLADLAKRARYLRAVLEADREQVRRYEAGRAALRRETAALAAQERELAALTRRQRDLADRLEAEQAARRDLLRAIQDEQSLAAAAAEELQAAAEALKALLARLEAEAVARALQGEQARPAGGFAAARGRLALPVAGEIVTPFGPREHPRFRTVTVSNGIEIRAPAGADVRAVADGRVVFAGWFRGYGKMLILDHGDQFYTLYAHAAELYKAVGEAVRQGDRVASVGDTGTLGDPVLYFEIRQAGKPLDPAEWLSTAEARRQ